MVSAKGASAVTVTGARSSLQRALHQAQVHGADEVAVRFGEFEEWTVPQADPVGWAVFAGDGFGCEVQVAEHRRQPVDARRHG